MYMHVHEAPEPPDARNADVPEWLRNIIMKCLSKNPVDRFANTEELRAALAEKYSPRLTVTPLAKRDRIRKLKMMAVMAGAAVVIIAAAGTYFWWQGEQKKQAEQRQIQLAAQQQAQQQESASENDDKAFQQAASLNTIQAYNTYLISYPNGSHSEEANVKIAGIKEQEDAEREKDATDLALRQQENAAARERRLAAEREAEKKAGEEKRVREDDSFYQSAVMMNTPQSYTTYLTNYPNGRHVEEAQKKLGALDAEAAEKARAVAEEAAKKDDQAFLVASNGNSTQAYNAYLISFPNGRHSEDANARIAAFDQAEKEAKRVRMELSSIAALRMINIPGGIFIMGSENGGSDEKPVNTITLSGFEMSSTEITQAQYNNIMGNNPSYFKLDDNCPVEKVPCKDAITFCNKLSEKVGLETCYNLSSGKCDYSKNGFRLPTEAEWEFACRAESGAEYGLGDGESALNRTGWYQRNSMEKTQPAGQKTPNAWQLYDMHGNVWEWCNDWYDKGAYGSMGKKDPTGPSSGEERVVRGGSWLDSPRDCRSAKRRSFDPDKNYSDIGFRIIRR